MKLPIQLGVCLILWLLVGCADRSAFRTRTTERSPELDLLNGWVGEWQSTSEMRLAGKDQPTQVRSHESISWRCNKQFLLEESTWQEGGQPQSSMAIRTWDPHARLFRTWYFDGRGMVGHSEMTYRPAERTWVVHTHNADPETCEPTVGEMTIRQVDSNRMDWHFNEFNERTHQKRFEMSGVSRRE